MTLKVFIVAMIVSLWSGVVIAQTSFSDRVQLSNDTVFLQRISFAVTKTAISVMSEVPGTDEARHASRVQLAQVVLREPGVAARRFALPVATNMSITAASSDAEIEAEVVDLWDAMAGVSATSQP